jgi:putative nucleotidyltransferase with HDIG domain
MKEVQKIKVMVEDLREGMYVSGLDRPWLETPFLLQGFLIESDEVLKEVRQYCQYVYVDTAQSINVEGLKHAAPLKRRERPADITKHLFPHRTRHPYQDTTKLEEELPKAKQAISDLALAMSALMEDIGLNKRLDMKAVKNAVDPMIESMMRNPDACVWLARMKSKDSYTYRHSVSCSIWAVALGRQLGLPKNDLKTLAQGGLLFDIGKVKLPDALLNKKDRLTPEEFEVIKSHVSEGVELLRTTPDVTRHILHMAEYHHERYDGSGYPKGTVGDDIPVFARIIGVIDCYDAITSERPYARPMAPSDAVRNLYEWRDIDFQAEIVEEFIQAIGIYPAGTLIELNTGEVGVVLSEYRTRRLRPKLLMILDENKQRLPDMVPLDLSEQKTTASGKPLEIARSLESGAYDIDADMLYI